MREETETKHWEKPKNVSCNDGLVEAPVKVLKNVSVKKLDS